MRQVEFKMSLTDCCLVKLDAIQVQYCNSTKALKKCQNQIVSDLFLNKTDMSMSFQDTQIYKFSKFEVMSDSSLFLK